MNEHEERGNPDKYDHSDHPLTQQRPDDLDSPGSHGPSVTPSRRDSNPKAIPEQESPGESRSG